MKATKEQIEQAAKIGEAYNVSAVFVNETGEFFTNGNLASLSVKHDKARFVKIDIVALATKGTNDLGTVDEVVKQIEAATSLEEIEAIYTAETEGKNRKTIIDACNKKMEVLTKTAQS